MRVSREQQLNRDILLHLVNLLPTHLLHHLVLHQLLQRTRTPVP